MKTNRDEIRTLKNNHRLEEIMQEGGEAFEVDPINADLWHGTVTKGLSVNIDRQTFELQLPGKEIKGDVITWLGYRFSWSFSMTVRYLKNRPRGTAGRAVPRADKKFPRAISPSVTTTSPVDHWQEKALQIGGEKVREFFSWSWDGLWLLTCNLRIEPVYSPGITHCQRCEKLIEWKNASEKNRTLTSIGNGLFKNQHIGSLPIISYSVKRRLDISDLGTVPGGDLEDAINLLTERLDNLYIEEEDGVICLECAWKEYDFQIALGYCIKSAQEHEQARGEELQLIPDPYYRRVV